MKISRIICSALAALILVTSPIALASELRQVVIRNDCCQDLYLELVTVAPDGSLVWNMFDIPRCYYGYVRPFIPFGEGERLATEDPIIYFYAEGEESTWTGYETIEVDGDTYYGMRRESLYIDKDGDFVLRLWDCPIDCCFPRECTQENLPKACDCGCLSLD